MKTKLNLVTPFVLAAFASVSAQGPLTPPGAPGPTMKTLDQVEPRTPITDTGVPGDAAYHHIITTGGSYYLTGNLAVTKPHGIDVRIEGVTIDLNGFEINRTAGAGGNGIEVDPAAHRCTIKNGSLKGFAHGLRCASSPLARSGRCLHISVSGCSASGLVAGEGWQLDGCTAHDNTGSGTISSGIDAGPGSTLTDCRALNNTGDTAGSSSAIRAGSGSTLTNCTAYRNTVRIGIDVDSGCTLTNCSATNNTVSVGIQVSNGCTLKNCAARSNTAIGMFTGGIDAGRGCTLIACAATDNRNTNATASPSTGFGIRIGVSFGGSSTVSDCTTEGNNGDGIQVNGIRSHLSGNTCTGNTTGGQGAGIHLTSTATACRIDGNHCSGGTRGIWVEGTDNLIIRNSAEGASVLAYEIAAGNHSAAIVNGPGLSFASTSPWANFRF